MSLLRESYVSFAQEYQLRLHPGQRPCTDTVVDHQSERIPRRRTRYRRIHGFFFSSVINIPARTLYTSDGLSHKTPEYPALRAILR